VAARHNQPVSQDDRLYQQIADAMAGAIRAGTLRRGERLPSVRELARQRGVSLSTATQAYRMLEDSRLVEARARSGYFVSTPPARLPEPAMSRPPNRPRAVDRASLAAHLMQLASDPAYISFGAAYPAAELFDPDRLRQALHRTAQRHRQELTRYAVGPGQPAVRRAIARHALSFGCDLDPERIITTQGAREAIALCLRAVTRPGDTVALESPTYFGFLEVLEVLGLRALEIPTHPRTGLSLDALQLALQTQPVKALLLVPTLSNPMGACLTLADRKRLAAMAAEHHLPVIEDVIYNDLAEHDDKRRAVRSFDRDGWVMLCGGFSKTLAPGLRLGWTEAGRWTTPVLQAKVATTGGQPPVMELAVADLLTQPGRQAQLRQLRHTIAQRVDEARQLIAAHFPKGTRVTDPPGNFILWVELPAGVEALALSEACLAEHICIAPGQLFSASERYRHCIRLGVGGRWDAAQRQALGRIGALACALQGIALAA
jgi:DNA-binding transcriptional MocR family regulator